MLTLLAKSGTALRKLRENRRKKTCKVRPYCLKMAKSKQSKTTRVCCETLFEKKALDFYNL